MVASQNLNHPTKNEDRLGSSNFAEPAPAFAFADGSHPTWHHRRRRSDERQRHRVVLVEVDSGYNTTINRFDGGVPRCKVELNASVEVDESFTY